MLGLRVSCCRGYRVGGCEGCDGDRVLPLSLFLSLSGERERRRMSGSHGVSQLGKHPVTERRKEPESWSQSCCIPLGHQAVEPTESGRAGSCARGQRGVIHPPTIRRAGENTAVAIVKRDLRPFCTVAHKAAFTGCSLTQRCTAQTTNKSADKCREG